MSETVQHGAGARTDSAQLPLEGVRVLDIATFVAAPFAATVMADFGADVIKIEQPGEGDPLRKFGTPVEGADTLVWLSEARNKRYMTLDLRTPEGADIFLRLVAQADVVMENFRPGTLERWGLGYERLAAANPRIVLLRVSAYGQTGPFREKPGFARGAHGFGGLAHLAGMADGPPVVPGSTSLADYISGLWGVIGVQMALRVAERSGRGQEVDIGLYESIFRLLDELAPAYAMFGEVRGRMGADVPHVVPHGHWKTQDGQWVALACSSDKIFERLARLMERPDLVNTDRFRTGAQRLAGRAEVNALIADWIGRQPLAEVLRRCDEAGVPCGHIMAIDDIFVHPQYVARGNLQTVHDERAGEVVVPGAIPRLSRTPARLRHLGGALGADTRQVLQQLLDIGELELRQLKDRGVV